MGATTKDDGGYGPSWQDVKRDMDVVSKAHNKSIWVQMGRTSSPDRGGNLYFRVVATGPLDKKGNRTEEGLGHVWPAGDWKTVPAMLLALLWQLDHRLTEKMTEAERQATF